MTFITGTTVRTEGWLPMRLPPPRPNGNANVNFAGLPTIFAVLGKLGLELHRQEELLPVASSDARVVKFTREPAKSPFSVNSPTGASGTRNYVFEGTSLCGSAPGNE
jgi:hypothetical protein